LLSGCELIDLEENPRGVVTADNFFNTPEQVESVLASWGRHTFKPWGRTYGYGPDFERHTDQRGGNLLIQLDYCATLFRNHYRSIKDLNFAIYALQNGQVPVTEEQYNLLMGQLKLVRAWNYFQLVRGWGDVPLFTEAHVPDYFNYQLTRTPVAEIYAQIILDFQEAIEKLPVKWPADKKGRPTQDAAKALLAKTYLTMATAPLNETSYYAKAADMAKEVMDAGNYSLVQDIDKVFSFETEYGPEMMWSFHANDEYPSTDPRVWTPLDGWSDNAPSIPWANAYPEQPRKGAYLQLYDKNGVHYNTRKRAPGIKKYLYDTKENFEKYFTRINIPIIRYADVLLIFAEAENMTKGGPTQAAVDALNLVIDRSNGHVENFNHPRANIDMWQDEFDLKVLRERNLELCFEHDRWFDMLRKRSILTDVRESVRPNFDERIYLWPIPEAEIRANKNMTQNPGY
jgi:hypothetical protein